MLEFCLSDAVFCFTYYLSTESIIFSPAFGVARINLRRNTDHLSLQFFRVDTDPSHPCAYAQLFHTRYGDSPLLIHVLTFEFVVWDLGLGFGGWGLGFGGWDLGVGIWGLVYIYVVCWIRKTNSSSYSLSVALNLMHHLAGYSPVLTDIVLAPLTLRFLAAIQFDT